MWEMGLRCCCCGKVVLLRRGLTLERKGRDIEREREKPDNNNHHHHHHRAINLSILCTGDTTTAADANRNDIVGHTHTHFGGGNVVSQMVLLHIRFGGGAVMAGTAEAAATKKVNVNLARNSSKNLICAAAMLFMLSNAKCIWRRLRKEAGQPSERTLMVQLLAAEAARHPTFLPTAMRLGAR